MDGVTPDSYDERVKNRLVRATSVIVLVSFFGAGFSFGASPMALLGGTCQKIGAKATVGAVNLTCVKNGKKLQWAKAAPTPIPAAAPTPSSTPASTKKNYLVPIAPLGANPITWQNLEARYSDISAVAWQSTQDTLKSNNSSPSTTSIKVVWAPDTALSHYAGFENYLRTGVQLWSRFKLPPHATFLVYSYSEIPWAEQTIKKILVDSGMSSDQAAGRAKGLAQAPYGGPECGGANSGMISDSEGIGVFGLCARNEDTDPYYKGPLQIHEFTHQLQGSQYIGKTLNYQEILPCWISEGLAHSAGISAGTTTLNSYLDVRKRQASHPVLNVAGGHSSTQIDASTITYDFLKKFYSESAPPGCFGLPSYSLGYSVGFLTTEALASIGGIESTLLLYTRTSDGESFETAFKNIYGISWTEASDILARTVSKEFLLF